MHAISVLQIAISKFSFQRNKLKNISFVSVFQKGLLLLPLKLDFDSGVFCKTKKADVQTVQKMLQKLNFQCFGFGKLRRTNFVELL